MKTPKSKQAQQEAQQQPINRHPYVRNLLRQIADSAADSAAKIADARAQAEIYELELAKANDMVDQLKIELEAAQAGVSKPADA